jgi:hypothetical protein
MTSTLKRAQPSTAVDIMKIKTPYIITSLLNIFLFDLDTIRCNFDEYESIHDIILLFISEF